ncbi:hypothetical protein [Lentibacillus sp.]|nr:hypothetical protein [Lentibacillus sp.]HLS07675.1 hypothetical protein [Lentibacillus sp.]
MGDSLFSCVFEPLLEAVEDEEPRHFKRHLNTSGVVLHSKAEADDWKWLA